MTNPNAYYQHLATMMLKTRGARFTAASSLIVRERWSVATTSFLSVFMLAWSVFLVAEPEIFSPDQVRFLGALSIVASVSVLVLTLLDLAYGRTVHAEKLQQNALKISVLMRRLERELCAPSPDIKIMDKIAEEYEIAIAETQVNHSTADYKKWQLESEKPKAIPARVWRACRLVTFNAWYYGAPIILHIIVLGFVVIGSIYYFMK
jgi:hypothetical protein